MRAHRSAYYRMAVSRSIPPRRVVGTSKGAPLPGPGRGRDREAGPKRTSRKAKSQVKVRVKSRRDAAQQRDVGADTRAQIGARGRHPFLIHYRAGEQGFPGPQEHRTPEKGHPRGDPDLFPGALDRPGPWSASLTQRSRLGIASLFLGAIQAMPRGRQPTSGCTANSFSSDSTLDHTRPKTPRDQLFLPIDKPFHNSLGHGDAATRRVR